MSKVMMRSNSLSQRISKGNVIAGFAMSLDGFIADAEDGVHRLFNWFMSGNTDFPMPDRVFKTSAVSAAHYRAFLDAAGAHITGRRDFDISRAWGGRRPLNMPTFIVTHTVPSEWDGEDSPFTFVTEGVERAIEKARAAAGDKKVLVGGSQITQQGLKAGLIDELQIELAPILLGSGIRLFDRLGPEPIELERTRVISAPGITHLTFRVIK